MVVALYGSDGCHFGWMLEGFVFDASYRPIAFPEGDDLYSYSDCRWLGTYDSLAVRDRDGRVVAICPGHHPARAVPSRLGRLPPKIKPAPSPLPEDYRRALDLDEACQAKRWVGLSLVDWLGQQDS
ncbi:4-fold beta flower protein [Stenotrophomonas muris]|uniref:4-fold beta flower protein n=1 Tax=Stenotrophomonas muris TaxID=2963283 RepID=UPI00383AADCA